ncbi:hypothetical protein GCM10009839_02900 [Catenulispora yoronensis]|uniref:Glycosyltransferase 2-like domain-containing protein n=1 Tax=Catenulispora yoronensis TaxID=450799 RepID=A0ABP5F1F6_9ACTN
MSDPIYNRQGLALLVIDLIVLVAVIWQPLSRRHDDSDHGTDRLVRLPPFRKPSLRRLFAFLAVGLTVSTGIIGWHDFQLLRVYQVFVADVISTVDRDPAAVDYAKQVAPLVPAAVVGYLLTLAVVLPATLGRRVMILLHAPLFVAVSVVATCLVGLAGTAAGVPAGLVPIATIYFQYVLGFMMIFRLSFTTYALPRTTGQPILRRGDWHDNLTLLCCLIGATGGIGTLALVLIGAAGDHPVAVFLIIVCLRTAISDVVFILLGVVKWAGGRRPQPGPERPALDVIIPAYNEAVGIERLLRSIDRAAQAYGGPVRVVLCDDGSTDETSELALAAMAAYRFATGEVIQGSHGGKAKALNLALARCTADYVYRLDADCAIDADAFVYSIPYFLNDSRVGVVGALTIPKEPYHTWIDRMRAIEQIFNFGFSQVMLSQVDAVPCILGSFTAFRRAAGVELGGFVSGMFGEDAEFTCALGRRGWRAALDPRIVSYEDVPPTIKDLRVQRFRWGMGGLMVFGRFTPFGNGAPGPRFWYQLPKSAGFRLFSSAHFFILMLALQYATIAPGIRHDIGKFAILLLISFIPGLAPRLLILFHYRRLDILPWSPLWLLFAILKRVFLLEAILACGVRPVRPPRALRARRPARSTRSARSRSTRSQSTRSTRARPGVHFPAAGSTDPRVAGEGGQNG